MSAFARKVKNMSFSQTVKEEIVRNVKRTKRCCATSFLTAVLKSAGSLCMDVNGCCFSMETDNSSLVDLCVTLAQTHFDVESTLYKVQSNADSDKNSRYLCKFDAKLGEILHLTERDAEGAVHIAPFSLDLEKDCCKRACMQGLFLACGSVTIPEGEGDVFAQSSHSNYHLELRFTNADFAQFVSEKFSFLQFRQVQRKNSVVLYLKESGKIADFFVFTDAVNARFKVENVIIGRSFRNRANRQRNCIDSNIDKSILAGARQLAAIEKIREKGRFETLPDQLKEVALARESHHDANLQELASVLGISKSGVNHRLTKLLEIAQDLQ